MGTSPHRSNFLSGHLKKVQSYAPAHNERKIMRNSRRVVKKRKVKRASEKQWIDKSAESKKKKKKTAAPTSTTSKNRSNEITHQPANEPAPPPPPTMEKKNQSEEMQLELPRQQLKIILRSGVHEDSGSIIYFFLFCFSTAARDKCEKRACVSAPAH